MATKSEIGSRSSPFGKFNFSARQTSSKSCYASMVYFHYTKQNQSISTFTDRERSGTIDLSVVRGVIEDEMASLRISKTLEGTSSFEVRLIPSKNWKQVLSPGDWVMLYMHDLTSPAILEANDTKNMLMLANIDRVSRSLEKDTETDKNMLRYVVSGRGIGKVFENTDIWFDPYMRTGKEIEVVLRNAGLEMVGNPSTLVTQLVNIFLGPGGKTASGVTPTLNNWRIPTELGRSLGTANGEGFYGVLHQEIEPNLPGYTPRQMLSPQSNGSLMELLKRASNQLVNQLYFEDVRDSDGNVRPTIVLNPRPINTPFIKDKNTAGINGKFKTLQDLAKENYVEVSPAEIKYEDLGKDDHSKFNLFWLSTSREAIYNSMVNVNAGSGPSNPTVIRSSIERDGLRRLDQNLEFCIVNSQGTSGQPDAKLFQGFLEQLYDMHFANHMYDAGTIMCLGILEAELGKALVVLPDANNPKALPKVYYIEGYEHEWHFPATWTTTFTLSHGQWLTEGQNIFIDASDADHGQPDTMLSNTYLAKTLVKNK